MSQMPAEGRPTAVLFESAGQAAPDPVQFSVTSQTPAAARQTVLEASKPSAAQASFTPSQVSTTSQMPAEARQTAVLFASAGHATLEPSQFSVRSHTPADGRQTTNAPETLSVGHASFTPS